MSLSIFNYIFFWISMAIKTLKESINDIDSNIVLDAFLSIAKKHPTLDKYEVKRFLEERMSRMSMILWRKIRYHPKVTDLFPDKTRGVMKREKDAVDGEWFDTGTEMLYTSKKLIPLVKKLIDKKFVVIKTTSGFLHDITEFYRPATKIIFEHLSEKHKNFIGESAKKLNIIAHTYEERTTMCFVDRTEYAKNLQSIIENIPNDEFLDLSPTMYEKIECDDEYIKQKLSDFEHMVDEFQP